MAQWVLSTSLVHLTECNVPGPLPTALSGQVHALQRGGEGRLGSTNQRSNQMGPRSFRFIRLIGRTTGSTTNNLLRGSKRMSSPTRTNTAPKRAEGVQQAAYWTVADRTPRLESSGWQLRCFFRPVATD